MKRRSTISIEVIWNEKRSLSFDECVAVSTRIVQSLPKFSIYHGMVFNLL